MDVRPDDVVLDLGCGSGPQDLLLARRAAHVIGIDVSAPEIERANARAAVYARGFRLEFRCTPIERAGFATHQFDKVFSFCVLEHIPNRDDDPQVFGVEPRDFGARREIEDAERRCPWCERTAAVHK